MTLLYVVSVPECGLHKICWRLLWSHYLRFFSSSWAWRTGRISDRELLMYEVGWFIFHLLIPYLHPRYSILNRLGKLNLYK